MLLIAFPVHALHALFFLCSSVNQRHCHILRSPSFSGYYFSIQIPTTRGDRLDHYSTSHGDLRVYCETIPSEGCIDSVGLTLIDVARKSNIKQVGSTTLQAQVGVCGFWYRIIMSLKFSQQSSFTRH